MMSSVTFRFASSPSQQFIPKTQCGINFPMFVWSMPHAGVLCILASIHYAVEYSMHRSYIMQLNTVCIDHTLCS